LIELPGQLNKIPRPGLGELQLHMGVLVDRGMAELAVQLSTHDLAEPQDGALLGLFHCANGFLQSRVGETGGFMGFEGYGLHDTASRIMGMEMGHWEEVLNIVKAGTNSKQKHW
jgi:hypothetical protein